MRLVIIGVSGFIGQQIIPLFRARNTTLLLVGHDTEKLARQFPEYETCDYEALKEKGMDADALLHLADSNLEQKNTDHTFKETNVSLLQQMIENCQAANISRIIYVSSILKRPHGTSSVEAEMASPELKSLTFIRLRLPEVYTDEAFDGKLGAVAKLTTPLRDTVFQIVHSFKPSVNAQKVANAVRKCAVANIASDEILSDCQEGNWFYAGTKKLIDFGFAISIILLFWWLLLVVWFAVKFTSKGPGILAQKRVGRFGTPFVLYKFRTMQSGTKQAGTHEVSASSVTSVGHILRKTKIDELPQVWNILKGEISLVGPRPCLPVQSELIEERRNRHVLEILPGITGYAQVRGVDMSDPVLLSKVDAEYVKLRSTSLDLVTILKTATGKGSGDRTSPSKKL